MKGFLENTWKHRAHVIMSLPVVLILFFFAYVPMAGLILAFKTYDFKLGIWSSPWCGLSNFQYLITSKDIFWNMFQNTLMYYVIFTVVGTFFNIVLAIAIDQFVFKKVGKAMQSIMIIPVFISFAAVQFIVYAYLSTDNGMINHVLGQSVRWYSEKKYWPTILTVVRMWNSVGYGSVLYMSVLAGVDTQLYEAARIDGANKWQQILHVTIPSLIPMMTVMLLLSVGGIMHSDTGLFYQVTRNSGTLYGTTQVIDSYVLNMIFKNANFGYTAAASLSQSVIGTVLILLMNGIVRKVAPENSLF